MGILEERRVKHDRNLADRYRLRTSLGYPGLTLLEKDDKILNGKLNTIAVPIIFPPHYSSVFLVL
jgi:hypothetical protein